MEVVPITREHQRILWWRHPFILQHFETMDETIRFGEIYRVIIIPGFLMSIHSMNVVGEGKLKRTTTLVRFGHLTSVG